MPINEHQVRELRNLAEYHRGRGDTAKAERYERLATELEVVDHIDMASPLARLVRLCDSLASLAKWSLPVAEDDFTDEEYENLIRHVVFNAERYIRNALPPESRCG